MGIKDVKAEARAKLALNMHQAVLLYTVEYAVFSMLIVMIVLACVSIGSLHIVASVLFICYGCILFLAACVGIGILGHAMVDYYLASYKCKPYNVRRLGDTLARNGMMNILKLNVKRVLIGFLLTLCLIVPGVIYLLRTSMSSFLLVANPKMKASTAISASSKVMAGKTGSYFSLMMSLFGWWTLGVLSFGLGFIFIMPYINMCKTVYYKRNLQGDTTVYKTVVQPISPPPQMQMQQMSPQMQMQMQAQQQMQARMQAQQQAQMQMQAQMQQTRQTPPQMQPQAPIPTQTGEQAQSVKSEPISAPIPAIDALSEEDKSDLNAAILDLESEPQKAPDVPEVPISPVPKTSSRRSVDAVPEEPERRAENDGMDLRETVKPLTTREVEESDVMSRKIDSMFSGGGAGRPSEKRDYFGGLSKSGPNDFVTSESDSFDAPTDNSDVKSEPVMSDADFDAFLRSFDAPEAGGEFKPLTRRSDGEKNDADNPREIRIEPRETRAEPRVTPRAEQQQHTPPASTEGESRLDRIRREREERRKTRENR